jgi:hypothetical protein
MKLQPLTFPLTIAAIGERPLKDLCPMGLFSRPFAGAAIPH